MERIFLYVLPEEYAEVKASGACWDDDSKRWYIRSDMGPASFSRWLADEEGEAEFGITSDEAFVAAAHASCSRCHETIEVICIYCASGADSETGDPMTQFTLSSIWAMDSALATQLERWRYFRKEIGAGPEEGCFANHCPHCGAMQEDYLLHAEPGDVFFGISRAEPGSIEFTPLLGRIQLSGDCSFEV
jgi:Domain of unknown function (DUF5710)